MSKIERALISVYDKTGILELARVLKQLNVEIISTGGTAAYLREHSIACRLVEEITGFPEILQGRVKTLHPKIFGGLLARREEAPQLEELQSHAVPTIDLVVINLYPFEATVARESVTLSEALENIDIGGPSLIRAAAKNFPSVAVVTSPTQYDSLAEELRGSRGELSLETRRKLAIEAFAQTSRYDAIIHDYLAREKTASETFPDRVWLLLEKLSDLRYGENPHQKAAWYREIGAVPSGLTAARQLHGKPLSFNNIMDLDAARAIVSQFQETCVAIIKHTNPCGVAVGDTLCEAYLKAKATDPQSAFGGIVALNREMDPETAREVAQVFTEAIVAPGFEPGSLAILQKKKNLRLIQCENWGQRDSRAWDLKRVQGGVLLQDQDIEDLSATNFKVVTERQPTTEEWAAMKFAWQVVKWVKSNAIVFAAADRTLGIGAGQMSRVDSAWIAAQKAAQASLSLQGSAVASDAFFPFRDGIDAVARAGATAVIQPGGSIRDEEVIQAADEHKMTMVFTNVRHFRH